MKRICLLSTLLSVNAAFAAEPVTQLPTKKLSNEKGPALGEGQAVREVRESVQTSSAAEASLKVQAVEANPLPKSLPPPLPADSAPAPLPENTVFEKAAASASSSSATVTSPVTAPMKPAMIAPSRPPAPPSQSAVGPQLKAKAKAESEWDYPLGAPPEAGFLLGYAFPREELKKLVGGGMAFGLFAQQPLFEGRMAVQARAWGALFSDKSDGVKHSLNVFPMEVRWQFRKSVDELSFFLAPGIGGAAWVAKAEREVDGVVSRANGFDFMVSGSVGAQYQNADQPWLFGADFGINYIAGYFDDYLFSGMLYTGYQF